MMNRFNKQQGLTLLEMLFVLVIAGAMAVVGFRYFNERALNSKSDLAVAQIQQINNAALAYFNTNNRWPLKLGVLQKGGYLPASMQNSGGSYFKNPWGYPYVDMVAVKDYQSRDAINYFSVETWVPNEMIARVREHLPNSQVLTTRGDVSKLSIFTSIPGEQRDDSPTRVQFMSVAKVPQGGTASIPKPQCVNSNYQPQIVYGLSAFCHNGSCASGNSLNALAGVNVSCQASNNRYNLSIQEADVVSATFNTLKENKENSGSAQLTSDDTVGGDGMHEYYIHKKRQGDSHCHEGSANCHEPGYFWNYDGNDTVSSDFDWWQSHFTVTNAQLNTVSNVQTDALNDNNESAGWVWVVTRCVKATQTIPNPCQQTTGW